MPTPVEIEQLRQLLAAHRQTLNHYLKQQATFSQAFAPPHIISGIAEAREEIKRYKKHLRNLGLPVEDYPTDEEQASELLNTHNRATRTGAPIKLLLAISGSTLLLFFLGLSIYISQSLNISFLPGGKGITLATDVQLQPTLSLVSLQPSVLTTTEPTATTEIASPSVSTPTADLNTSLSQDRATSITTTSPSATATIEQQIPQASLTPQSTQTTQAPKAQSFTATPAVRPTTKPVASAPTSKPLKATPEIL